MGVVPKFGCSIHCMKKSQRPLRPVWLDRLLASTFFGTCEEHRDARRSEENIYCMTCTRRLCCHCADVHSCNAPAGLLQIRRYVYHDVVRVHDVNKLLDLSKIQPYTVNGAKVVHLNPRGVQSKPYKSIPGGAHCAVCGRTVADPNCFCCIACKMSYASDEDGSIGVEDGCNNSNSSGNNNQMKQSDVNPAGRAEELLQREVESPSSCVLSPQPSDSFEGNPDRPIGNSYRRKSRKGSPKRARFL